MKRLLLTILATGFVVFVSCNEPTEKAVDEPATTQAGGDTSLPEDATPVTASEDATVTLASDVTQT